MYGTQNGHVFLFIVLGIQTMALGMLGKHTFTELHLPALRHSPLSVSVAALASLVLGAQT